MVKIIMHGSNGRMGRTISEMVKNDEACEIAAGINIDGEDCGFGYPVFSSLDECDIEADVMIDFSSYLAADAVIDYCLKKKLPLIECTTGLNEDQLARLKEAGKEIAVLRSANMSLGINMLYKLVADAAKLLAPAGFDIELVERHHNLKKDSPSGTAIVLAEKINEACDNEYSFVYDRSTRHESRRAKEIGISAVRGGSIVGDHEVIFAGPDEVIEFKHTAYSKAVFGKGAVEAAKFLAGKPAGMYDMQDVV